MSEKFSNKAVRKNYIDGWRGLAIIAVLYSHFLAIGDTRWLGSFGVDLFFALSGYLMANVLFIKGQEISTFFLRRASRILPVFLIYTYVSYQVHLSIFGAFETISTKEILSTIFFLRSYLPSEPSIWETRWAIGHYWSLNIEEHTYILLAIITYITNKKSYKVKVLAVCSSIIITFVFRIFYKLELLNSPSDFTLYSHVAAYSILFSVFVRMITYRNPHLQNVRNNHFISLVTIFFALVFSAPIIGKPIFVPFFLAVAISYLHLGPKILLNLLSNRLLIGFGNASFSLYLWQQLFYVYVNDKFLALGLTLTVGFSCYRLVELPARTILNDQYSKWIRK